MSGSGDFTALFPSRINASQFPTPAAAARTNISPSPGTGRGSSSMTITLGGPNLRILAALIIVLTSRQEHRRPALEYDSACEGPIASSPEVSLLRPAERVSA